MVKELLFVVAVLLVSAVVADYASCGGKPADVFFLLDSSGSLTAEDFRKELKFTNDVIDMFDVGPNQVRVGVASFSKTVEPEFELGQYSSRLDMIQKISNMEYEGLGTNTGEALRYLHTKGLSRENVRPNIPRIAVVLTDGQSQDRPATLAEADQVHKAGIVVFVIGIGSQVDKKELEAVASSPASKYVYMIDNFDALDSIKDELAIKACEVKPVTPAPDLQNMEADVGDELRHYGRCTPRHTMDIVFAVDTASIGASNTKFVLQFIANISDHLSMDNGETGIATLSNGCSGGTFDAEEATSAEAVKESLSTYTAPKFEKLVRSMRLKASAGRRQERLGVLLVNDHLSSPDYRMSRLELRRAKFQRVSVVVLGVGLTVDEKQARSFVRSGKDYFYVTGFDKLGEIATAFLYNLCLQGVRA